MNKQSFIVSSLLSALAMFGLAGVVPAQPSAVNVRLVTDEAEAVLAILAKKKATTSLIDRLVSSERP